jgi:lysophospholipase L1-like esterase
MRWAKILFVQAVLAIALAEVALHIYNPLPARVRGDRIVLPVHRRYRFHNARASKLEPVTTHTKNSLGFRGPEPPTDFPHRLTLLTIGGSTTECLFLSDGKTWTDVMARRLQTSLPDLWVNNAGLDGQSTYGHLHLLRDFVEGLHPRGVVFLFGVNDLGLASGNPYDGRLTPSSSPLDVAVVFLRNHSELVDLAHSVFRVSHATNAIFAHNIVDVKNHPHLQDDAATTKATIARYSSALPAFRSRVASIIDECRSHGIEPIFVTQPGLYGEGVDPATGVDLSTLQVEGPINARLWWRVQELYNDVTRSTARERGVTLVDAARELPKDSRLFYDFMHFTNAGADQLGELIAKDIEPRLRNLSQKS